MEEINAKKRARDELDESPDLDAENPEVKRLRESLLDDDSELSQDLVLFMKTFDEEIMNSSAEFGYLLEASDDDLGIPPTISPHGGRSELQETEAVGLGTEEFWPFEWKISSFDQSDGLFDFTDTVSGRVIFHGDPKLCQPNICLPGTQLTK